MRQPLRRPGLECERLEERSLPDGTVAEVAAGVLNLYRATVSPTETHGLPVNEVRRSQLDAGVRVGADGESFVPAMLGNMIAVVCLSNAYRQQEPAFTAGYGDAEMLTLLESTAGSVETILSAPGYAYTDPATGKQAFYQVHSSRTGAPLGGDWARIVSGLDNSQLVTGLAVGEQYLRGLGRADLDAEVSLKRTNELAERLAAVQRRFDLRMWYAGDRDAFFTGAPERPRAGVPDDRFNREGRLFFPAAAARGELSSGEMRRAVENMLAKSHQTPPGTPGTPVERLSYFGTALEAFAVAPFVTSEQRGPFGEGTLYPTAAAWAQSAARNGLPAGGATGIAVGNTFRPLGTSPAEVGDALRERDMNQPVLVPVATAMMAGATLVPPDPSLRPAAEAGLEQLRAAVAALKTTPLAGGAPGATHWHPRFGMPNYLSFQPAGESPRLVDERDPVYGFLESSEAALAALNGLLGGRYLETLLNRDPGWFDAARQYQDALNVREAEFRATGFGKVASRANASGHRVWQVEPDPARLPVVARSPFLVGEPGTYALRLRYSNDSAPEKVTVLVNGAIRGSFDTVNTGSRERFVESPAVPLGVLPAGEAAVAFRVDATGDRFGLELDRYQLTRHDAAVSDPRRAEGDSGASKLRFAVSLSSPLPGPSSVNYAVSGGTATAGVDFAAARGTLTFEPGETLKVVEVEVFADRTPEADETVFLDLSGARGGIDIGKARGVGTVLDDDRLPGALGGIRVAR